LDIETLLEYRKWVKREYVAPITCPGHPAFEMIPYVGDQGLMLVCPTFDYEREVSLTEYKNIQHAVAQAERKFLES